MIEPAVLYSPAGITELGVPAGSYILWYQSQMRWVLYEPRPYDHGVILNYLEQEKLVDVTPGPGLREALKLAADASSEHPSVVEPNRPQDPPSRSVRARLRVVR